jgi:hypothetical protein
MENLEKMSVIKAMTDKSHEKSRKNVRHHGGDGQKSGESSTGVRKKGTSLISSQSQ